MPTVNLTRAALSYRENGEKAEVNIIEFWDYYGNIGAVPLHSLSEKDPNTVPGIIGALQADYDALQKGVDAPLDAQAVLLTAALLFKQSFTMYKPYTVLELGCNQGLLTYSLAKLAYAIHPESRVFALSEDLYDIPFLNIVNGLGVALSCLNLLTTSPTTAVLGDGAFDFTVINGTSHAGNPDLLVQNALRVTKAGGRLVCLTCGQRDLKRRFIARCGVFDEYPISDECSVLVTVVEATPRAAASEDSKRRLAELWKLVLPTLSNVQKRQIETLKDAVRALSDMEDVAIELFGRTDDVDLKNKLNILKETLLNHIYNPDEGYRQLYRRQIRAVQTAVSFQT
jgi:SAM-dependent methyltransferase